MFFLVSSITLMLCSIIFLNLTNFKERKKPPLRRILSTVISPLSCGKIAITPSKLLFSDIYRIDPFETIEGWAHYCEEMMLKQGFYKDPIFTEMMIIADQFHCAMRVIYDIQMHCRQLSQEDAIKMLTTQIRNEAFTKAEIVRYTSTPGWNISYFIGKLLIEDLRREVEEKMGSNFSLKFFHDTILRSGDLPYYLLKQYFDEIIN